MPRQKTPIIITVGMFASIIILAATFAILTQDIWLRYPVPQEWVRIGNPALETGPEWSRLNGVWASFNGHLFLKVKWNATMEFAPLKSSTDIAGNYINAYYGMRGVELKLGIGGIDAWVSIRQIKEGYWWSSIGTRVITGHPIVSNWTTKVLILELAIPWMGFGQTWLDFIHWREVKAYFQFVSDAGATHLSAVPTNSTHTIIADGEYNDWHGLANLSINEGIMASAGDFGAITNVSALFSSDGLAFMMCTHGTLQDVLSAYPAMNLEACLFMGIEAFQEEPVFFEHSYNPNLMWERIDGNVTRSNIVYHLSDTTDPRQFWNETTFVLAIDQWNVSTIAELILSHDQIQPLLELKPIDYYNLNYMLDLKWWENTLVA